MTQTNLEYETRSFWTLKSELHGATNQADRESVMAELACLHVHARNASVRQAIDCVLDRDMAERAFARGAALIKSTDFNNFNDSDTALTAY